MIRYRCDGEYVYPCDLGSYQYRSGQSGCKICPDGTYDPRNSTSGPSDTCYECEENYVCVQGHKRPCRLGTYSYSSAQECFPCYGDPEDPNPCIQGEPPVISGKLCNINEYVDQGRVLRISAHKLMRIMIRSSVRTWLKANAKYVPLVLGAKKISKMVLLHFIHALMKNTLRTAISTVTIVRLVLVFSGLMRDASTAHSGTNALMVTTLLHVILVVIVPVLDSVFRVRTVTIAQIRPDGP